MKGTIKGESKNRDFPKLMKGSDDMVALMTKDGCGVVVITGDLDDYYKVGDYSEEWAMKCFKDFNGTIELSNDE